METQLPLIDPTPPAWTLDRRTREVGRRGVARAREALRRAVPAAPATGDAEPDDGSAEQAA
jgi:hypothetical protein